jgi:hypothetical protein
LKQTEHLQISIEQGTKYCERLNESLKRATKVQQKRKQTNKRNQIKIKIKIETKTK